MESLYNKIEKNKKTIDKIRPFEADYLIQLREYYRIGLTWTSNALEGNTLNETETKIILEDGITIGGKPLKDIYEAVGHSAAYDYIFSLINKKAFKLNDIKEIHRLFYKHIEESEAGKWRNNNIIVTGTDYIFPKPDEIENKMLACTDWANSSRNKLHPIDFAAILHLKFVTIHPFVDGNGRVGRLLMNLALIQDGYMLALIPPLLRYEYLSSIKKYQQSKLTKDFCTLIAERVYESQKEIIRLLHLDASEQQRDR